MRRDWRGPSSSSTINSVRLRGALDAGGATVLKVVSKGDSEGMAEKLITAVGGRIIGGRWVIDRARWSPGELIGGLPVELLVASSAAQAEDMSVGIGHGRIETGVGNGIFAVNIAA